VPFFGAYNICTFQKGRVIVGNPFHSCRREENAPQKHRRNCIPATKRRRRNLFWDLQEYEPSGYCKLYGTLQTPMYASPA
jgi:hypothetical protein